MWVTLLSENAELLPLIVRDMREWDRREIFATQRDDNVERFMLDVLSSGPAAWMAGKDSEPIAAFGAYQVFPGLFSMWFFATDSLNKIGKSMTQAVKTVIVPELFARGARRLECRSMEGHVDAQRWLAVIGAKLESRSPNYGRGGETFLTYVWERP